MNFQTGGILSRDAITNAITMLNTDHGAVHKGYGLCSSIYLASLAASATKVWRLKSPSTLYAHIKNIQVLSQGSTIKIELIKNATITTPGVEIMNAFVNLNDNFNITPQSKIYDSNVAFTGGVPWCTVITHGDTTNPAGASAGQFSASENIEYVTKSNSSEYIIKLTNVGTSNATHILFSMFLYEEPKGTA